MTNDQQIHATLMEIGDDEEGNPRLLFHTTREQIMRLKTVPLYELSRLTIEPEEPEEQPEPSADEMDRVDLWREKRKNEWNGRAE